MSETTARLALTMLQYIQAQPPLSSPARWWILPDLARLRYGEVLSALEAMPKPVVLGPMVEQGMLATWRFDAASPRGKAQLEHDLQNQQNVLQHMLDQLVPKKTPTDVLLELEEDEMVFSSTELLAWAREYLIVTSGWRLGDSGGDSRAPVRLLLRRADGTWSPGAACRR